MSTGQYKDLKGLKKENLRDNMTTLELVLNMPAEATTTEISRQQNPSLFAENLQSEKPQRIPGKPLKAESEFRSSPQRTQLH